MRISDWSSDVCSSDLRNLEAVRQPHQPRAFAWGQSARSLARALRHQNFRAVLVVARRQGTGNAVAIDEPETEPVAGGLVLGGVVLQVGPEIGCERVTGIDPGLREGGVMHRWPFAAVLRSGD